MKIDDSSQYEVIGEHDGSWYFTIGQRGGWHLDPKFMSQLKGKIKPLYVIDKNVNNNTIIVGPKSETLVDKFTIKDVHWINISDKKQVIDYKNLTVRIRHLGELIPINNLSTTNSKLSIKLAKQAFGVAPGQAAVLYQGNQVLGGGIIY